MQALTTPLHTTYYDSMNRYLSNIYDPHELDIVEGDGAILRGGDGREYIDFFSAYSASSFGHAHPEIVDTVQEQAEHLNTTSRAIETRPLNQFAEKLCTFANFDQAIPMNSGTEAVETALKAARLWGYRSKGISENEAEIITAANNFHGRTISIVSFSTNDHYREPFGPHTPGFRTVEFGDIDDLKNTMTDRTCAVLLEPMQGEGGVIVPPNGYLNDVRQLCADRNVLLAVDEIQTGLARTGKDFAYEYEIDRPDLLIVGKALGAGVHPVSALLGTDRVMDNFEPGMHGSTYGGNPVGCAVGMKALDLIEQKGLANRSYRLGKTLKEALQALESSIINDVRGRGLWLGVELKNETIAEQAACDLADAGVLTTNSHEVLRLSPPLTIDEERLKGGIERLRTVLS